jgi:hypothetical protein
MALEGNLQDFVLTDVIQLVHMGKKNGALKVNTDEGDGTIYFQEGLAVHATSSTLVGDKAICRVLQWHSGRFVFEPDLKANLKSVESSIQQLVLEVARQTDEWAEIKKLVPHIDLLVTIVPEPSPELENIKLEPHEWKVLALVEGTRMIRQICEECAMTEFEVCKVVYELVALGLLKVTEKPKAEPIPGYVPPSPAVAAASDDKAKAGGFKLFGGGKGKK